MAEYLIQGETLESMADKIRILNGVEGALTTAQMDGNLGEANTEVGSQADLITQISNALEGKAISSGGNTSSDEVFNIREILKRTIARSITEISDDELTTIGNYAFRGCSALTSVSFPACTRIDNYAFFECSALTSVSFPACANINNYAFAYCSSLKTADFPKVTTINNSAFYKCLSLTSMSFPSCINIGNDAFWNCKSITDMNFPSVTNIGNSAFRDCSALTSINLPVCKDIGSVAFYSCYSLKSINLPVLTSIREFTFGYCSSLASVDFPEVTTIDKCAFDSCSQLTTARFPAVTTIISNAFYNCHRLSSITIGGAPYICKLNHSNAFSYTPYAGYKTYFSGTPAIYVPASLLTKYKSATNWTYFSQYMIGDESLDVEAEIISFTIDNTTYQAREGMTWSDWIDSEYNISGYSNSYESIVDENNNQVYLNNVVVNSNDFIQKNTQYKLLTNSV